MFGSSPIGVLNLAHRGSTTMQQPKLPSGTAEFLTFQGLGSPLGGGRHKRKYVKMVGLMILLIRIIMEVVEGLKVLSRFMKKVVMG